MDSCLDIIGEVVHYELNIDFVPAYFPNIRTTESHLLTLPARLPAQYNQIVVVTPTLNLSRESISPKLHG
ncbi:MAG TPA: hypothetical protein ENH12_00195 [Proteobacteria bacterium]|nr:hypothetical protein [Pseudomonadota bacterium]